MIGPGRFVAIVGPSGAGKDSLLRAAAAHFAGDPAFHFPRRLVTRPPSAAEDNIEIAADAFATLAASGGFAVSWSAHGHGYALPVAIDDHVRAGREILCNVSRTIVPLLRLRYAATLVIEITAPRDVLSARLGARGRVSDGSLQERLERPVPSVPPDIVIRNDGTLQQGAGALIRAIERRGSAEGDCGTLQNPRTDIGSALER